MPHLATRIIRRHNRRTVVVLFLPLATLLLCVQSNSLLSQEPSQQIDRKTIHETVEAVAAVIKAEYFDPDTAEKTSDALHERLAQARYANTRSLEHLAENLTRDLLQLTSDKHLVVAVTRDRATESLPTQKPSDESRNRRPAGQLWRSASGSIAW